MWNATILLARFKKRCRRKASHGGYRLLSLAIQANFGCNQVPVMFQCRIAFDRIIHQGEFKVYNDAIVGRLHQNLIFSELAFPDADRWILPQADVSGDLTSMLYEIHMDGTRLNSLFFWFHCGRTLNVMINEL